MECVSKQRRHHANDVRATPWTWANVNVTLKCVVNQRENVTCEGVLFTHSVGCSKLPSTVNDLTTNEKLSKYHSELLCEEAASTSRPVLWCRSFHELRSTCLWWISELHQWSFHCHHEVLDEDDECHFWYWLQVALLQTHGENGAILLMLRWNSERSFIGAFRPEVLREIHQFFQYLKSSSDDMR